MRTIKKRKVPTGFGERLYNIIIESKMSYYEIEQKTGVNHTNLYEYVQETMLPSAYNLYALCKLFNVSADYLLGLSKERNICQN